MGGEIGEVTEMSYSIFKASVIYYKETDLM